MDFAGELESHITVDLPPWQPIESLMNWAGERGLKCLHIVLDRGLQASQPMLSRRQRGTLAAELTSVNQIRQQLEAAGFHVSRIKIEAAPENIGVPRSDAEAAQQPKERYFEHHVKLLLKEGVSLSALGALAEGHSAHLSRNALHERAGGRQERFVTQRSWRVGRATAQVRLAALVAALEAQQYEIAAIEEEYVVYDSNLTVDAGWIKP